jgi:hypothetical protein
MIENLIFVSQTPEKLVREERIYKINVDPWSEPSSNPLVKRIQDDIRELVESLDPKTYDITPSVTISLKRG